MPYFMALTVISNMFHMNALETLGFGGIVSTGLFLVGAFLFFREYFENDWAPLVGIIVLTCAWGLSWYWSNVYQLRNIFHVKSYPSFFVFAATFFYLWIGLRLLKNQKFIVIKYIFIFLLSSLMFLCHPLTGVFAIFSLCLLVVFSPLATWTTRLGVIGAAFVGSLVAELWPYFSVWSIVLGKTSSQSFAWLEENSINISRMKQLYWGHPFYSPLQFMVSLGPALLGIAAWAYLLLQRKHLFIVLGALCMGLPYLINIFIRIPLGHRFLLYHIFYLHMALIWFVLQFFGPRPRLPKTVKSIRRQKYSLIILAFLVLFQIVASGLELSGRRVTPDFRLVNDLYTAIPSALSEVSEIVPEDAVIMAPRLIAWPVPTFVSKVVGLKNPNPLVRDLQERDYYTDMFFSEDMSQGERLRIIQKYNVDYILVDERYISRDVFESLQVLGSEEYHVQMYKVIKVS